MSDGETLIAARSALADDSGESLMFQIRCDTGSKRHLKAIRRPNCGCIATVPQVC
jgi:hypothetical protein